MAKCRISEAENRQTNLDHRPARRYHLTPEGLRSLQESIRQHRPWQCSTGPKTAAGKALAKMNALKHGDRSAGRRAARREIAAMLRLGRHLERQGADGVTHSGAARWLSLIADELRD